MKGFRRRTYRSFAQFRADVAFVGANARKLRPAPPGGRLDPAFRERLMLAVTAVNRCRYCAYVHGQAAVQAGLSREETRRLLSGVVGDCPDEDIPALAYAQHWAEADGNPEPEAQQELAACYGVETAEQIEIALRMIRVGNLAGNTFDALLYFLSGGRLGR
jgi:AhpD family alkylhydroperoxidase